MIKTIAGIIFSMGLIFSFKAHALLIYQWDGEANERRTPTPKQNLDAKTRQYAFCINLPEGWEKNCISENKVSYVNTASRQGWKETATITDVTGLVASVKESDLMLPAYLERAIKATFSEECFEIVQRVSQSCQDITLYSCQLERGIFSSYVKFIESREYAAIASYEMHHDINPGEKPPIPSGNQWMAAVSFLGNVVSCDSVNNKRKKELLRSNSSEKKVCLQPNDRPLSEADIRDALIPSARDALSPVTDDLTHLTKGKARGGS